MIKLQSNNSFNDGLMMDMNPLTTPNTVMTNCLNGTLVTFNGNEHMLQNDMGNGRVETAYLPEGYVPVGTAELGGIIYIVSYNPFKQLCLIGSFPSPERNFTTDELTDLKSGSIRDSDFKSGEDIIKLSKLILFTETKLFPGDKYLIFGNVSDEKDNLSAYQEGNTNVNKYPKRLKLRIASIDDNNNITYLKDLIWESGYYIKNGSVSESSDKDLDEYRNLIESAYNIFNKTSGKLAVIAQLEVINTFSVSWNIEYDEENEMLLKLLVNWTYDNVEDLSKVNMSLVKIKEGSNVSEKGVTVSGDRKNDGTDKWVPVDYSKTINPDSNELINLEVIPGMDFGWLPSLALKIIINPKLIGSGKMQLLLWRYYGNNNSIIINCGLSCNTEPNKQIKSIDFKFYEADSSITESLINTNDFLIKDEDVFFKKEDEEINLPGGDPVFIKSIINRLSYSGYDSMVIDYSQLPKDKCYLVDIVINYENMNQEITKLHCLKICYTSDIFNDAYLEEIQDFGNLVLSDYLKLSYKDNISNEVISIKNPEKLINQYDSEADKEETGTLDYTVTGVNTNTLEITVPIFDVSVKSCQTTADTFKFPDSTETLSAITGTHTDTLSHDYTTLNQVNIIDKYTDVIKVPYSVIYSDKTNYIPSNQFINLKISQPLIFGLIGQAKELYTVYSGSSFTNSNNTNDFESFIGVGKDGASWTLPLSGLKDIYTSFKMNATGYDVVPVAWCTMYRDSGGHDMNFFVASINGNKVLAPVSGAGPNDPNNVTSTTKNFIISFALKLTDGEWNVFNKTPNNGSNRKYVDIEVFPDSEPASKYMHNGSTVSTGPTYTSINQCIQKAADIVINEYFNNIYRVADETERLEIQANNDNVFYTYLKINTYGNFEYEYTHKVKPTVQLMYNETFDISTVSGVPNLDVRKLEVEEHLFSYKVFIKNNTIANKLEADDRILVYDRYAETKSCKIVNVTENVKNSSLIVEKNGTYEPYLYFETSGNTHAAIIPSKKYAVSLSGGLLEVEAAAASDKYVYRTNYRGQMTQLKVVI